MIDINKITIKNNAMFNIVMRRPKLCKMCLERILDKKITEISYPESERTIDIDLEAKSVRLDIYCENEDAVYNIELQNGMYEELPKRSRYYQDMIDVELIDKGADYSELKNNIVIFICTFDEFGKGRHLYTFENICVQDRNLKLDDKTTKIFLNTKGTKDDIPAPLKNFLKYMDDGSVTDDFTREIDEAVNEVRRDKKWRKKIMTVEQLIKDEAKLAHKKGFSEGEAKGKAEGKAEGINLINDLHNRLLKDKRYEDLEKSTVDKDYQNQLLAEYGLK